MILEVQCLLLALGFRPYITTNKPVEVEWENGTYMSRESYDLNISGSELVKFNNEIGFLQVYKMVKLHEAMGDGDGRRHNPKVVSIEDMGKEEVYDFSVEDEHCAFANGFLVHNCGEAHLLPYQTCTLGSINLALMIRNDEIDWSRLSNTTYWGVRFLDDVLTVNNYPIPQTRMKTLSNRKIGLGVMGWADLLSQLKIVYDSSEALSLANSLMGYISTNARLASELIAQEKGAYPSFKDGLIPVRNATRTTIAPTGTISLISDCSSGIEPHYAVVKTHKTYDGEITVVNPYYRATDDPALWRTAHEIHWKDHIKMQAAFQENVDDGISKTINMPDGASRGDVSEAFMMLWESGCKGGTVFRDGCKGEQVLGKGELCPECRKPMKREGSCWYCDCGISYCS